MSDRKLVSVITPAYNAGNFIHRLLDSILTQTYPKVEMFVIDDGSKDNTSEVVKGYLEKFTNRGYTLNYVYQENSGQSVAINNGLKLVSGDFLVWPDSDDYYATNDAIERMVDRLESATSDFAMVRVQECLIKEGTNETICIKGLYANEEEPSSLFEDCVMGRMYFMPGGYMIRFKTFVEENGLDIYTEKDAGQNWQMFMPILYRHRCLTIKEPLYNVVIRSASHSRGQYEGFQRTLVKIGAYERTVINALDYIKAMGDNERNMYKEKVRKQYASRRYQEAIESGKPEDVERFFNELNSQYGASVKEKYLRFAYYHPYANKVISVFLTPVQKLHAKVKAVKPL